MRLLWRASNVTTSFIAASYGKGNCWTLPPSCGEFLPCIVQGRYDVICPMRGAWALHRAWPEAELRVIDDAGHAAFEPGTARELVRATDQFAASRQR